MLGELSQKLVALELRNRVIQAVRETLGDSILLSGGLDTGIIAAVISSILNASKDVKAYTSILKDAPAPDIEYSKLISSQFGLTHQIVIFKLSELEDELPQVIQVLRSFDPMEIRNSAVTYIGMKKARSDGRSKVMTGDASDELFAGYNFVFKETEEKARKTLAHLWEVMHFSSFALAKSLGMEAKVPFLHPSVKDYAMHEIGFDLLRGQNKNQSFGKFILRKAFEDMLPREITWRAKTPIEYGSGTAILPQIYSKNVRDFEFIEKRKSYLERDGVKLRDKEQLHYYEIFRNVFGPPVTKDKDRRTCSACKSNVPPKATFCTICGEYPI